MKMRLCRRGFLKVIVIGIGILGSNFLFENNLLFGKELFNVGDITITWAGVQPFYLPCAVAKEKGFFEEEGVKVGKKRYLPQRVVHLQ